MIFSILESTIFSIFYALESRKILIFILWKAENLNFLCFGKQKMLIFAA